MLRLLKNINTNYTFSTFSPAPFFCPRNSGWLCCVHKPNIPTGQNYTHVSVLRAELHIFPTFLWQLGQHKESPLHTPPQDVSSQLPQLSWYHCLEATPYTFFAIFMRIIYAKLFLVFKDRMLCQSSVEVLLEYDLCVFITDPDQGYH